MNNIAIEIKFYNSDGKIELIDCVTYKHDIMRFKNNKRISGNFYEKIKNQVRYILRWYLHNRYSASYFSADFSTFYVELSEDLDDYSMYIICTEIDDSINDIFMDFNNVPGINANIYG